MPRRGIMSGGLGVDPNTFASQMGDPNGNSSIDQEMNWAKDYLAQNPDWTGNGVIGVNGGQVFDKRPWIDKHSDALIAAGSAGVGLAGLGAFGGAGGAGGGADVSTSAAASAPTTAASGTGTGAALANAAATGAKMDPTWGLILSSAINAAGSAASSQAPYQAHRSFAGTSADPAKLLTAASQNTQGLGAAIAKMLSQPVQINTKAQNLPGFAEDPGYKPTSGLDLSGLFSGALSGLGTGTRTNPNPGGNEKAVPRGTPPSGTGLTNTPSTASDADSPIDWNELLKMVQSKYAGLGV